MPLNLLLTLSLLGGYLQPDADLPKGTANDAVIRTLVGSENRGDGLPAERAVFLDATGVAVDPSGNSYVADKFSHTIRRIDASTGIIQTIAGTGRPGFGGDQGPALAATLSFPASMAFDALGNLFVADVGNKRIRRIDAETGIITTVAGTGNSGRGGDGGLATEADFVQPVSVAIGADNALFIADRGAHVIRRVDLATGIIDLYAGSGGQGFTGDGLPARGISSLSAPEGVGVDSRGRVYIADTANHRIRVVDPVSGLMGTIAGSDAFGFGGDGGPANRSRLFQPVRVAIGPDDSIYIADLANRRIRRIDATSRFISTVIGTGESGTSGDGGNPRAARITPIDVAVAPNGDVLIAEGPEKRIRRATGLATPPQAVITTLAGGLGFDSSAVCSANLTAGIVARIGGVATDSDGQIYVADAETHTVSRIDLFTGSLTVVAGRRGTQGFSGDGGQAISATLNTPLDVAVAGDQLYIVEATRLRRVDLAAGSIDTVAAVGAQGLTAPLAVAAASDQTLYLLDGNAVKRLSADGSQLTTIAGMTELAGFRGDGGAASNALLDVPADLALDGNSAVIIADSGNNRLRRIDLDSGTIDTIAGSDASLQPRDGLPATEASLLLPSGVSVDASGAILVSDTQHQRVRRIDPDTSIITTIAGTGVGGFSGDRGPARNAMILNPGKLAVDARGRINVVDQDGIRVRLVVPQGSGVALPDGTGPGDRFGTALAAADNRFAVGIPNDARANGSGSVAVYRYDGCRVQLEVQGLVPPEGSSIEQFGRRIAMTDNLLVVAGSASDVSVFERSGSAWTAIQALTNPANAANAFGLAIAAKTNLIAIGAPGTNGADGAVHLFQLGDDGRFAFDQSIQPETPDSNFGGSIGLNADALAIGSPGSNRVDLFDISLGAATDRRPLQFDGAIEAVALGDTTLAASSIETITTYVVDLEQTSAAPISLRPPDPTSAGGFGTAVAVSDGMVLVGAPLAGTDTGGQGALYDWDLAEVVAKGGGNANKTDSPFYQAGLGVAVAIARNLILGGAPDTASDRGDALTVPAGQDDAPPIVDTAARQLTASLAVDPALGCPGFYIGQVSSRGQAGRWAMEIQLDPAVSPLLQGGLNLGGGFGSGAGAAGFAAFNIANANNEPQQVSGEINVTALTGSEFTFILSRRIGSERIDVFTTRAQAGSLPFEVVLEPGFYSAELFGEGQTAGDFTISLTTAFTNRAGGAFQGGVNVGGVMRQLAGDAPSTGFAAFCIDQAQDVVFRTAGADGPFAFGASGVPNLELRVLDRNRVPVASDP